MDQIGTFVLGLICGGWAAVVVRPALYSLGHMGRHWR